METGQEPDLDFFDDDYGELSVANIKSLDALATQYYNKVCKSYGRSNGCWKYLEMHGRQNKKYPHRKVEVIDIEDLQYSVVKKIEKPSLILSQDYCNALSSPGSFNFVKSSSISSTASWSITEGLEFSKTISGNVGIPNLGGMSYSDSLRLSFSST